MRSAKTFELKWCNLKPRVLVHLLCLMQLWIVFGMESTAARINKCAEVIPCEIVCEIHFKQLLLALSLPYAEETNSSVVRQPF
jgi:hypothetical protein